MLPHFRIKRRRLGHLRWTTHKAGVDCLLPALFLSFFFVCLDSYFICKRAEMSKTALSVKCNWARAFVRRKKKICFFFTSGLWKDKHILHSCRSTSMTARSYEQVWPLHPSRCQQVPEDQMKERLCDLRKWCCRSCVREALRLTGTYSQHAEHSRCHCSVQLQAKSRFDRPGKLVNRLSQSMSKAS